VLIEQGVVVECPHHGHRIAARIRRLEPGSGRALAEPIPRANPEACIAVMETSCNSIGDTCLGADRDSTSQTRRLYLILFGTGGV